MAGKTPKAKPGKSAGAKKKRVPTIVVALPAIIFLIYFLNFATLLVLLGMVPSFVANYVEQRKNRGTGKVVMACNAAGVVPFIADLLGQGINPASVHALLLNGYTWLVMFGAAGCGWALVWALPQGIYWTLDMAQKSKIATLQKRQTHIVEEWGHEVEAASGKASRNAQFKDERTGNG